MFVRRTGFQMDRQGEDEEDVAVEDGERGFRGMRFLREQPYDWPMDQGLVGMYEMPLLEADLGTELFRCTGRDFLIGFRSEALYRPDGVVLADVSARIRDCVLKHGDPERVRLAEEFAATMNRLQDTVLERMPEELPASLCGQAWFSLPGRGFLAWDVPKASWKIRFPSPWGEGGCSFQEVLRLIAQAVRYKVPDAQSERLVQIADAYPAFLPSQEGAENEEGISFQWIPPQKPLCKVPVRGNPPKRKRTRAVPTK